jgi:hypothetical protein
MKNLVFAGDLPEKFALKKVYNKINLFILTALIMVLVGCQTAVTPTPEPTQRELLFNFFAQVYTTPEAEVKIELGLAGVTSVPGDEQFDGVWELRDESGALRASGQISRLAPFAGEYVPVTWQSELEPGQYELLWGAPAYGGLVRLFTVEDDSQGGLRVGLQHHEYITTDFPPTMPDHLRP